VSPFLNSKIDYGLQYCLIEIYQSIQTLRNYPVMLYLQDAFGSFKLLSMQIKGKTLIVLKTTQEKILAALQSVAGIIERRNTLPILANVLIRKTGIFFYRC
jgi:hypothetical protein